VDVKVNAVELLRNEILRKRPGTVWVSGVCDPYQPLEGKYKLTRKCLEILAQHDWSVVVQTRSPLVLRDMDILKSGKRFEVGFSVTTADDRIRRVFEPSAPSISERLRALDELHQAGIRTFAMIAPLLPGAVDLVPLLAGKVDYVIVDRMNYNYANWVYKQHGIEEKMTDEYFQMAGDRITAECRRLNMYYRLVY